MKFKDNSPMKKVAIEERNFRVWSGHKEPFILVSIGHRTFFQAVHPTTEMSFQKVKIIYIYIFQWSFLHFREFQTFFRGLESKFAI